MRSVLPLALVAALLGCGREVPRIPALSRDAVIVAFGNSLTQGVGAAADGSYPAVLESLTGRTVINAGVSGELASAGASRLPGVLDEHRPDLLILCHGGNDLLRNGSRDELESNLREMLRVARLRGIPVVLLGVPEPGLFLSSAEIYERLAGEYGLPYEGEVIPDVESDSALKSDPIHPNAAGYRRIAEAVRDLLREAHAL